jgi:hypothetical protein
MTATHPIEVYDLRRTCLAAPSPWEGRIGEHGSIYIRYRWGKLRARVSMTTPEAVSQGESIFDDDSGSRTGDRLDGFMETEEMQRRLVCRFHGACDEDAWDAVWVG